ncbi:histidine phosphatase family protein [Candidatus Microgenomates bacterium]|nr:histidine phosphatase family protein [Candidatus Microgenomates bacterium]
MRHGQAENPEKIIYGRRDGFPLSVEGREQVRRSGQRLADRSLAAIYSSPLTRCFETAEIVAKKVGKSVLTDARLVEIKNYYEGRTVADYDRMFLAKSVYDDPNQIKFGETAQDICDRMRSFLEEILGRHKDQVILVVSHADPIMILKYYLEGRDYHHFYKIAAEYLKKGEYFEFCFEGVELVK